MATNNRQVDVDEEKKIEDATFSARPYQTELVEICLKKNSIIYLPTGAGKTYIALMVMKELAATLAKPLSEGGKRSVFLVNTVVLAYQQKIAIEASTGLQTAVYTGEMNVDAWRRDRWYDEINDNQVLVATCQIILDIIRHGYIKLSNFNLIIFDECHHGRKSHPMHQLMRHYGDVLESERPRIIGLTGMLIDGNVQPETVIEDLKSLESTFHSTIATVKSMQELNNVLVYSTNPIETIVRYYDTTINDTGPFNKIRKIVNSSVEMIEQWPIDETHQKSNMYKLKGNIQLTNLNKSLRTIFNDFVYQMDDMGVYGASIAILSVIIELELKKRASQTIRTRQILRNLIAQADKIRHILVDEMGNDDEDDEMILTNGSAKLINLIMYLRKYFLNNDPSNLKALVFVHRRYTAKCLYHVLKRYAQTNDSFPIVCDFMVGNNSRIPESIEKILENKWNRCVVDKFRRNEINLIVASSVLEEGIDLQMCNLVVSYDAPLSFRSYVQSKGRARMSESTYSIIIPHNDYPKLVRNLAVYQQIDKVLKEFLICKAIDRSPPLEADIKEEFSDETIEPFRTCKGATLEALSAVQLLNRYCMTLPNDSFTPMSVSWTKELIRVGLKTKVAVTIKLPMQSIVKEEIVGDLMSSLKLAKRSVAFKACIKLYEHKELNDNLMPINNKRCLANVHGLYFKHWDKYTDIDKVPRLAGTTVNIRLHNMIYPDAIVACKPEPNQLNYLYIINMCPAFKNSTNDFSITEFYRLLGTKNQFGILTTKLLPDLAEMNFYFTFGQVNVKIIPKPILIKPSSLNRLYKFHQIIFNEILQITNNKEYLINDFDNLDRSYLIVPTKENAEINWEIVNNYEILKPLPNKTVYENYKPTNYCADEFLNSVVWPMYRSDKKQRYIVTRVRTDMTPLTKFPNSEYKTFAHYFQKQYGCIVQNQKQFLLEVKGVTNHLNRLVPGIGDDGSKTNKNLHIEYLIPELCHNYEFPGDLWLKAVLLPNVLHRLHYLLHAEHLRVQINNFIGITCKQYTPDKIQQQMINHHNKIIPTANILSETPIHQSIDLNDDDENDDDGDDDDDDNNDIVRNRENFISLDTSNLSNPWSEIEEPIDFERHIQNIFPFELDYYLNFISDNLIDKTLKLTDNNSSKQLLNRLTTNITAKTSQIMIENKQNNIKLLKLNTFTQKNIGPSQTDLLAAITCSTAHDIFDMERFEVLGDAFLKFSISLFLLQQHPEWHEGFLTSCKGQMVSNRNLCYLAQDAGINGIINGIQFNPSTYWMPPMFTVPRIVQQVIVKLPGNPSKINQLKLSPEEIETGNVNKYKIQEFLKSSYGNSNELINNEPYQNEESAKKVLQNPISAMYSYVNQHKLNDKQLADCIEAIIGACLISVGIDKTFSVLQFFNILPRTLATDVSVEYLLKQKYTQPRLRANILSKEIDNYLINYEKLEKHLNYKFNDRAYLLQALTHPSYATNTITGCYQQLEFLGDAVLDLLITSYCYEQCPNMNPGQLTDLRSALVNNITLACLCVRYQFHLHILSQNVLLSEKIASFVSFQASRHYKITDAVQLLVEETDNMMAEQIDVPKLLGDVFEAIIGAVFLDSGNNLEKTWSVIYSLMADEIREFIKETPLQLVRQLYEFKNANPKFDEPHVEDDITLVTLTFTCDHKKFRVKGFGRNKEDAKKAAAKVALNKLKNQKKE